MSTGDDIDDVDRDVILQAVREIDLAEIVLRFL